MCLKTAVLAADGTQETIEKAMAGVPGQLLEHEFVDFSTTRNWALRVRPPSRKPAGSKPLSAWASRCHGQPQADAFP